MKKSTGEDGGRNEIREERGEGEREELATYRVRTKAACRMRDALRRLSEGFRDRLKRFDSTHDTGKYVRVYMCYLFVLTLFFLSRARSLSLSFYVSLRLFTHTNEDKRDPLVYVLRIIISSLSLSLSFSSSLATKFFALRLVETSATSHWLFAERERRKKKLLIRDCKSTARAQRFVLHVGDN